MEKLTERFRLIPNIAFNNDGFIFDQIVVGKDFFLVETKSITNVVYYMKTIQLLKRKNLLPLV